MPAKKPVSKKPAVKKPVAKKPVKKTVAKKPTPLAAKSATSNPVVDPNAQIVGDPGNAGVEPLAWNQINPKVNAAAAGGAAYTVALYVASLFGVDLSAIPVPVLAAAGVLVTWLAGYAKRIKV